MKALWSGRLSTAKSGWLMALLFFGFLAFLFVPAPEREPEPTPPVVKPPPTRLVALGLPDNPDLERLPEYFALYADKAEWKNDKTIFAYWNPGSNSHSYFFEATRADGSYHFKAMPEQIVGEDEVVHGGLYWSEKISTDSQIRFIHVFDPPRIIVPAPSLPMEFGNHPHGDAVKKSASELIKLPLLELNLPPLDVEQKK